MLVYVYYVLSKKTLRLPKEIYTKKGNMFGVLPSLYMTDIGIYLDKMTILWLVTFLIIDTKLMQLFSGRAGMNIHGFIFSPTYIYWMISVD